MDPSTCKNVLPGDLTNSLISLKSVLCMSRVDALFLLSTEIFNVTFLWLLWQNQPNIKIYISVTY